MDQEPVSLLKSELAERLISMKGKPLSFKDYPFIRKIYDGNFQSIILKTGRQVSKSTTLANFMLVESVIYPYFSTMYISTSEKQAMYFSSQRFSPPLESSDALRKFLLSGTNVKNNVALKQFANWSTVIFRYASDDPDRARGYSVDRLCYDEIQDMHPDVFGVINECTTMSPYGFKIYSGTPKSMDNCIETFWQDSSQNEWVMKCTHCNHWNIPTIENIHEKGMVCKKCLNILNVRNGQWVSRTSTHDYFEGFHIPQIILPWHTEREVKWKELLYKLKTATRTSFRNEVMGESDSTGARLLSLEELRAACTGVKMNMHEELQTPDIKNKFSAFLRAYRGIFAGIDWSGGGRGTRLPDGTYQLISRNALVIIGLKSDGTVDVIAHKVYPSDMTQPESVRDMIRIMALYKPTLISADAGEGNLGNAILRENFGTQRVIPFRYSGKLAAPIKWNPNAQSYIIHKTSAIDNVLMFIKRGKVHFSSPIECEALFHDILAVYEETTQTGEKRWLRPPRVPDDSLHSLVFAYFGAKIATGQIDTPMYGENLFAVGQNNGVY